MAAKIKKTLVDTRRFASEHAPPNFHELKMRRHTRLLVSRSHLVLLARILLLSRQNANGRSRFFCLLDAASTEQCAHVPPTGENGAVRRACALLRATFDRWRCDCR